MQPGQAARWIAAAGLLAIAASCAARQPFVRPSDPGAPAPQAGDAWAEATGACRAADTYWGALGISGRVGARTIRGLASAQLYTAVTAAGEIGLEASVSGQMVFKLGGGPESATLLLRDGNRVVTARPDDILDALIGVKLTPGRLLAILAGCVSRSPSFEAASGHGRYIQVTTSDATVFLERQAESWRARAGYFDELAVDYWSFEAGMPRDFTVRSQERQNPAVSLRLRVQDLRVNTPVDRTAFVVNLPASASRMALEELRALGPLGGPDNPQ